MTSLIMAAALLLLAAARIPALRRGRDAVFMAAIYAGTSSLLQNDTIYPVVDEVLGGINVTKLVLNSFMIIGLWYLREAVIAAISPDAGVRGPWMRRLPMIVALVLQALFFVLAQPTTTTVTWGDYLDRPAAALFSLMVIAFIAWSCSEIAWACFRFIPRMRKSFRVGFSMVAAGCIISVGVMLRTSLDLCHGLPGMPANCAPPETPLRPWQMVAIVLVGVGLTIPAMAGRAARKAAALRLERTVTNVSAIRDKALQNADMDRVLQINDDATPQERLHRMIVEIWDAELASATKGSGASALTREDRDYMLLVESDFDLGRTR